MLVGVGPLRDDLLTDAYKFTLLVLLGGCNGFARSTRRSRGGDGNFCPRMFQENASVGQGAGSEARA